MPNADNYKLLNKTAILVLLTQINLHQISKQEYKRISVPTQPWIPNSQDTVFSRGMIKFCGQRQRHKGQVSIISSTDPCVLANHLLWVCNIPLLLLVSNSQTQMPPPCTENKHLSSGLEYLYKIKEKKKKKSQGNIRATAGRAQHTAIHYRLSTEQEHQWQLPSCCSLCKNMQRPRDSPIHTTGMHSTESSTSFPKLPSQLPAVPQLRGSSSRRLRELRFYSPLHS